MDSKSLMQKFLSRTASPREVGQLLDRIRNHEEDRSEVVKEEWNKTSSITDPNKDFSPTYRHISEKIHWKKTRSKMMNVLSRAAAIALVAASVYFFSKYTLDPANEQLAHVEMVEKANPIGQKSKIQLPDGTVVWLNAESKLFFPSKFDSVRNVELTGEAYFEVARNSGKPFLVTSGNLTTQALGTAFNVRAFKEEGRIQVSLTEGKVKVSLMGKNEKFVLEPGSCITYLENKDKFLKSEFSFNETVGWKDGILSFKDADREEVFAKLSRWYGVTFNFRNSPGRQKWEYTSQFQNEYLDNILLSIGSIKNFDFTIDNNIVEIIFN